MRIDYFFTLYNIRANHFHYQSLVVYSLTG
nr:MAG TPA: hypothetical protein [Caudoviricetes sp.]